MVLGHNPSRHVHLPQGHMPPGHLPPGHLPSGHLPPEHLPPRTYILPGTYTPEQMRLTKHLRLKECYLLCCI